MQRVIPLPITGLRKQRACYNKHRKNTFSFRQHRFGECAVKPGCNTHMNSGQTPRPRRNRAGYSHSFAWKNENSREDQATDSRCGCNDSCVPCLEKRWTSWKRTKVLNDAEHISHVLYGYSSVRSRCVCVPCRAMTTLLWLLKRVQLGSGATFHAFSYWSMVLGIQQMDWCKCHIYDVMHFWSDVLSQ